MFHAILIYGSDTWYICNRKVLLLNMVLYLSIICYSFFVSISPVAIEAGMDFLNVKVTANSLSRSNYFNLFVIFFDGLIVTLFDTGRSKFMMLVKKRKREVLEVPLSRVRMLRRLWIMVAISISVAVTIYIIETATKPPHNDTASRASKGFVSRINEGLYFGLMGGVGSFGILCYLCIVYHSSGSVAWKTLNLMMHERRLLFIIILLGIKFYVDNIYFYWAPTHVLFQCLILASLSLDLMMTYYPRRVSLSVMGVVVLLLLWNIYNHTFVRTDCEQYQLRWGIFGEEISYCTIYRIIYQSILSLMFSSVVAIFRGRTDNLFFCNANIYRATGTLIEG